VNREQALQLVRKQVRSENLVNHMLATEAIMGSMAL
jgi:predicted hydrolase (HD superfamily)